jgi:hypothetical protein
MMALARKNKIGTSSTVAQRQRLRWQQCNIGGSFGRQRVAAVALVAALAMVLAEQWQWWVRQQSTKKTTIN